MHKHIAVWPIVFAGLLFGPSESSAQNKIADMRIGALTAVHNWDTSSRLRFCGEILTCSI